MPRAGKGAGKGGVLHAVEEVCHRPRLLIMPAAGYNVSTSSSRPLLLLSNAVRGRPWKLFSSESTAPFKSEEACNDEGVWCAHDVFVDKVSWGQRRASPLLLCYTATAALETA